MKRIEPSDKLACPHCGTTVKFDAPAIEFSNPNVNARGDHHVLTTVHALCPDCDQIVVSIGQRHHIPGAEGWIQLEDILAWPQSSSRPPLSEHVPKDIASDYQE